MTPHPQAALKDSSLLPAIVYHRPARARTLPVSHRLAGLRCLPEGDLGDSSAQLELGAEAAFQHILAHQACDPLTTEPLPLLDPGLPSSLDKSPKQAPLP